MMKKRFFDIDIWKKPWFRMLAPEEKVAWYYLTAQCDNVGVWDTDFAMADFSIGKEVDWEGFRERVNGNIEVIDDTKWWLCDFCAFQHPDLFENTKSKVIQSYVVLLKSHNLWVSYQKAIGILSKGYKEREQERERERVEEKVEEKEVTQVMEFFKEKTGSHVVTTTEALRKVIRARLKGGHSLEECKKAIMYCYATWKDDDTMKQHIRIITIFRPSKFSGYVDAWYREMEDAK